MWLGVAGLGLMALLMAKRVQGALMIGIAFTTFISWIPNHAASYLGASSQIPGTMLCESETCRQHVTVREGAVGPLYHAVSCLNAQQVPLHN